MVEGSLPLSIVTFVTAAALTEVAQSGSVPLTVIETPVSGVVVPHAAVFQLYSHRLVPAFQVIAPFVTLQPVLPVMFTTMPVRPEGTVSTPTWVWTVLVPLTVELPVGLVVVRVAGSVSVQVAAGEREADKKAYLAVAHVG